MVRVWYTTDGKNTKIGMIIVDYRLVDDVVAVFEEAYRIKYQISSVVPISVYNHDDNWSMEVNNSSGFNRRCIAGTETWSVHAFGMAIDLNPKYNPMIMDGVMHPPCGIVRSCHPMHLHAKHPIVLLFKKLGWIWGGDWANPYDPHHFQKDLRTAS